MLAYLRPMWALLALVLVLTLVTSGLGQVPQLANRYLIDHVLTPAAAHRALPHGATRLLAVVALGLFGLRLLTSGIGFVRGYASRILGQRLTFALRRDVYGQVLRLSADFYIQSGVGQIMSRVMNDTNTVQSFLTSNVNQMLSQVFTFAVTLGILIRYDPRLTLLLLLFGPPIAGVIVLFGDRLRRVNRAIRRQMARLTAALHDALAGFITVKAFSAEDHVIGAFGRENVRLFDLNLALMRTQAAFSNSTGLITGSSAAFFLLVGGLQVIHREISLGTYFLINGLRGNLFLPFTSFATISASYQQAAAGADRIFEYLDTVPSVRDRPGARAVTAGRGAVTFDDVFFRYPAPARDDTGPAAVAAGPRRDAPRGLGRLRDFGRDLVRGAPGAEAFGAAVQGGPDGLADRSGGPGVRAAPAGAPPEPPPALRGVSFEMRPGEMVGLVGPSGGGKTTVASLLLRLYDCDGGAVRLDGHDVRDLTLRSLRGQVALVLQDVYLFSASVRENVAFGLEAAGAADVDAALRAANAHFVWDLPDGPDTVIGEGGLRLSGGQRQRVAIARALLRRPRVLILDEATSAQDNLSESAVMHGLRERDALMSVLVIAHRLSTVTRADRILVLDRGQLVEQGRHDELLAASGLYARLYGTEEEAGSRASAAMSGPGAGVADP